MAEKVQTQMWLKASTKEALRRVAEREGIPMAALADDILADALPRREVAAADREASLAKAGRA